tara:strand:+ start:73 stop:693 length:621 start_codon:yes stop_codon:yes gene_type:complete
MIIQCESCSRKFIVKDIDIPEEGRTVQCGYCSVTWHQKPITITKKDVQPEVTQSLSVEKIKASDGKTYKFLGSQWAELLPSGKTGLFAKKQIGKELDKLTGRKVDKVIKKKTKKTKEVDPSEGIDSEKRLPEIYKPKEGLGFFGYIFLIIIIGFSIVGILRTFENDLINYFPQTEYIYELLDEQLEYIAETVKNIIVIINDLINSY